MSFLQRRTGPRQPEGFPGLPPILIEPIGWVRNKVRDPDRHDWSGVRSAIVLRPDLAEALDGLDGFSHLIVVCWLDRVSEDERQLRRVHPAGDPALRAAFLAGTVGPDMGMYPGGEPLFSDLAHYVRSGELARALVRAARSIAARSSGSPTSRPTARARAPWSRGGMRSPVWPSVTTSRHPRMSVATTARPEAMASMAERGTPSR